MKVAVIIINWNGKELLKNCLESLQDQSYTNFSTIVVDNGSSDGSVDFVKQKYSNVKIIELEKNTGFAYANNIGIQEAFKNDNVKYVVTLNNDTVVDEHYLKELVSVAERGDDIGSVQPKVINYFDDTKIDSTGILISKDCAATDRGAGENTEKYNSEEEIFRSTIKFTCKGCEAVCF